MDEFLVLCDVLKTRHGSTSIFLSDFFECVSKRLRFGVLVTSKSIGLIQLLL